MGKCGRRCRGNFRGCLLGALFLLIGLAETTAFADSAWFNCSVNLVGPGKTETFISLTDLAEDPAFVDKWFLFPADRARETTQESHISFQEEITGAIFTPLGEFSPL